MVCRFLNPKDAYELVSLLRASYDEIIKKDGFKGGMGGKPCYPGLDLVNGCIRYVPPPPQCERTTCVIVFYSAATISV